MSAGEPRGGEPDGARLTGALAVHRVHELEAASRGLETLPELRRWWLRHGLEGLLDDPLPAGLDRRELREESWSAIDLSARRLELVRDALDTALARYREYETLEPRLRRWCGSLVVAVCGSTGMFDAAPTSDLDIAIVAETDRPERCEFAVRALVVWPWKLELLGRPATRELWPGGLEFDDPSMGWAPLRLLEPASRHPRKYEELAVLLTSGRALAGGGTLEELAAAYAGGRGLPRRALAVALKRRLRKIEAKLRSPADQGEQWRRWLSTQRMYQAILAILALERDAWGLNPAVIAERLALEGAVAGREREAVRRAALWALYGRRVASGRPVGRAASRVAFAAFRELQELVERRLAV